MPRLVNSNDTILSGSTNQRMYQMYSSQSGFPTGLGGNQCVIIQAIPTEGSYNAQLAFNFGSDKLAIRRKSGSTTWSDWKYISIDNRTYAMEKDHVMLPAYVWDSRTIYVLVPRQGTYNNLASVTVSNDFTIYVFGGGTANALNISVSSATLWGGSKLTHLPTCMSNSQSHPTYQTTLSIAW